MIYHPRCEVSRAINCIPTDTEFNCISILYVSISILYVCISILYVSISILYVCISILYVSISILYVLYVCIWCAGCSLFCQSLEDSFVLGGGGDLFGEPPFISSTWQAGSRCHLGTHYLWNVCLFMYTVCLLISLQFARVLRKIQETVVIGFLEEYPFWFAMDFVKRFVFVAVIIYEKDSEVPKRNTPVCKQAHIHTYTRTCIHTDRHTKHMHMHAFIAF